MSAMARPLFMKTEPSCLEGAATLDMVMPMASHPAMLNETQLCWSLSGCKNVAQAMRPRRPRRDSAMTVMTAASKATDMVLRASVRTQIWTDMAPSW